MTFQSTLAGAATATYGLVTRKRVKAVALVSFAGPMTVMGLGVVYLAWTRPGASLQAACLLSVLGACMAGFWPCVAMVLRRDRHALRISAASRPGNPPARRMPR